MNRTTSAGVRPYASVEGETRPTKPMASSFIGTLRAILPKLYWVGLLLILACAATRTVLTYSTFTQTYDEAYHLPSNMEWLDRGTYTYEFVHPPLARNAVAIGHYVVGTRSHS